jgi:rhodanese-related sulfurtransferase
MTHQDLAPSEALALIQGGEGWIYLDVRTEEEFQAGHAADAWNVPFAVRDAAGRMAPNPQFLEVVQKVFPKDSRLVVGCASGVRSEHACRLLDAQGYEHLANLSTGFLGARDGYGRVVRPGWQAAGMPCESAAPPERTYAALRARR